MAVDLVITWAQPGDPADYARRFRTAASINDFSPALREIGVAAIAPAIIRNFAEGGRPKWTPLDESTIRRKMQEGFFSPNKILVATGEMMDTATDASRYNVTSHTIEALPGPFYWRYHQRGTEKMPQRVLMNLQIADQRRIGGIFDKFIADHLAKHGLKVRGVVTNVGGGDRAI